MISELFLQHFEYPEDKANAKLILHDDVLIYAPAKQFIMNYRAEIDGLRALAVTSVILFHTDFDHFSGGYVGVDVFFVISGYLITSIIVNDLELGRFSVVTFYERRVRRIFPALFFVTLACLPFAWFWFGAKVLEAFSESAMAVALFCSNILFWTESGYFDTQAEYKPLLHTWSLSVEEQFYILFPWLLVLIWWLKQKLNWTNASKKVEIGILGFLFVASLCAAQYYCDHAPEANFYLLPTRVWELLIGTFTALYLHRRNNTVTSLNLLNLSSTFGLILIILAIAHYDSLTPFPSLYALVPTLGTALIILHAQTGTWVHRLLSTKPLVGLGLISYSAYLWHYPLFAFSQYRFLPDSSPQLYALYFVIILVLAYFSWKYIETPFRNRKFLSRKHLFMLAGAVSLLTFVIGGILTHYDGVPERVNLPDSVDASIEWSNRTECFEHEKTNHIRKENWFCLLGRRDQVPTFLLVGDSHSLSLLPAFDQEAAALQISGAYVAKSSCPPLLFVHHIHRGKIDDACRLLNQRVHEWVKELNVQTVFLVARWSYFTEGDFPNPKNTVRFLTMDKNGKQSIEESRRAFAVGLKKTIQAYSEIGVNVVIVPQVPHQLAYPDSIYFRAFKSSNSSEFLKLLSVPYDMHLELQKSANEQFGNLNVNLFSIDEIFCDHSYCKIGTVTESYYVDDDHLSNTGAMLLAPQIRHYLDKQLKDYSEVPKHKSDIID